MANQPSSRPENAELVKIDVMSDGSRMYWADVKYYKDLNMEYLQGFEFHGSLKYDFNTQRVLDKKIKGQIMLKYEVLNEEK